MNYYNEIKEKILKSEIYDKAKDYSKDRHKVKVYFEIGKILSKAGKVYGKSIIKQYSEKLMIEVGKKYNERTLRRIRQFYELFANEKWSIIWTKLSWSHFREVLSLKDINKIRYYLNNAANNNLTIKQLQTIIKNNEYDRLSDKTRKKLIEFKPLKVDDLVPNPILIKISLLDENLTEYALKEAILNNLDEFLLQLGYGFTYVGNEFKIKYGNKYNYIDLLLFNYEYNCFVVIELKVTELKKEHIGQILFYMNYIDNNLKKFHHDKTIGIIICKKNNKYIIEYCSDDRIIAKEYKLV